LPLFVKRFEGFVPKAAPDPDGFLTIGFGHKITGADPDTYRTKPMALADADALLLRDLLIDGAQPLCSVLHPSVLASLNDNQYAALIDFTYNEGIGRLLKSMLLRLLNQGQIDQVATQFDRWIYGEVGGHEEVLEGLVERRQAETELWSS
jgi:lysozyme